MAWPTGSVDITDTDAGADDPSQARLDIKDMMDKVNLMVPARGAADGVSSLDATGNIPVSELIKAVLRVSNLSDLASIATARTNLGGTTIGINLFTITTAALARAQIGLDVTAKGEIYVATANDVVALKTVGANGTALKADSGESDGLRYSIINPMPSLVGFTAINDGVDPDHDLAMTIDYVAVRNPVNDDVKLLKNVSVTVAVDLAGPIANGRDIAGAFTNNAVAHYFIIWNGTVASGILSQASPTTGPVLPSGYTHWCYATSTIIQSGPVIDRQKCRGSWVYLDNEVSVVTGGTATTFTKIDPGVTVVSSPLSLAFLLNVRDFGGTRSGSGQADFQVQLSTDSSNAFISCRGFFDGLGNLNNSFFSGGQYQIVNNTGFWYRVLNTLGTGCATNILLCAYQVLNGGE